MILSYLPFTHTAPSYGCCHKAGRKSLLSGQKWLREFESIYQKRKSIFSVPHRQKEKVALAAFSFFLFTFHSSFCSSATFSSEKRKVKRKSVLLRKMIKRCSPLPHERQTSHHNNSKNGAICAVSGWRQSIVATLKANAHCIRFE